VTDVEASLRFYMDRLGFTWPWRFDEEGQAYIAQVDRQGCSGLPRVKYGHTGGLKVIHISGHNRHAVNKGSGRDQSVTIGPRTGHVEHGAPLGNCSINRKDTTVERGQNIAIHPGSKNRALFRVTPLDEADSYLQFQY